MTDIDVLTKALKKAEEAGWDEFKSQYCRIFKASNALMVEFLLGVDLPPLVVSYERVICTAPRNLHRKWSTGNR